jgi:SAM-dependent methyltransferase
MGRFAEVCADAGAEIHGVDLSRAVDAAARNLGHRTNVSLYQADIMNLPFAEGTFDYVYSIGVLHHTPDTRKAFESLVPLVKPGGEIAIWVDSVSTRRMVGALVFRLVTPRLPAPILLTLCRIAVPLVHVHRIPLVGRLTRAALPTSMDPMPEWRWLDTFDWYAPTYQWKHTDPEVESWFSDAGLVDLVHGPFEVSVRGRKPDAPA